MMDQSSTLRLPAPPKPEFPNFLTKGGEIVIPQESRWNRWVVICKVCREPVYLKVKGEGENDRKVYTACNCRNCAMWLEDDIRQELVVHCKGPAQVYCLDKMKVIDTWLNSQGEGVVIG